jgi:hypothetical protein
VKCQKGMGVPKMLLSLFGCEKLARPHILKTSGKEHGLAESFSRDADFNVDSREVHKVCPSLEVAWVRLRNSRFHCPRVDLTCACFIRLRYCCGPMGDP